MKTNLINGDVMNQSNQLQNDEIQMNMDDVKTIINLLFLKLEDGEGVWMEKPEDEDGEMTLWVNGIDFDEGDYQKLEHMWYCFNVYKTSPRMSEYHWRLLNEIMDSLDKIIKE